MPYNISNFSIDLIVLKKKQKKMQTNEKIFPFFFLFLFFCLKIFRDDFRAAIVRIRGSSFNSFVRSFNSFNSFVRSIRSAPAPPSFIFQLQMLRLYGRRNNKKFYCPPVRIRSSGLHSKRRDSKRRPPFAEASAAKRRRTPA